MPPSAGSATYAREVRRSLAGILAVTALVATGCAAQKAASVEPTVSAPAPPAPDPRPSAEPGFAGRGPAQVVHKVDTQDKVVFLTIDDGLDPDPALLAYLNDNHIPVTVFLTTHTVTDWQYWRDIGTSASIQNHTDIHPALPKLGLAGEQQEICRANEAIAANTDQSPWMLRPPYGAFDASTAQAAGQCGLDWLVHWSVSLPGDRLEYQSVNGSLEPGDIILTHFRKDLVDVLPDVIKDIESQGFEVGRLEDYLTPRGVAPKASASDVSAPALSDMQMDTETESRAYKVG